MSWIPFAVCLTALLWPARASSESFLLPTNLRPQHYKLTLAFDVNKQHDFPFYGVVEIQILVDITTKKIVLHSKEHKIDDDLSKIKLEGPKAPNIVGMEREESTDFLILRLDQLLMEGAVYKLIIPFYGNLKQQLKGAYVSSYVDLATNQTEYLITTQFEAISARIAFPCFDEPMMKATFTIEVGHHEDFTAISNMPVASVSNDTNLLENYWPWSTIQEKFKMDMQSFKWNQFLKTVPMSTYLIAFVISKFVYKESPKELSNTTFKIWARKDAVDQTSYAATIGPKVLSFYEKWFNVSFPLPKQDMIGIPDFAAGAMENWGLITYRESSLLYSMEHSSLRNKERIAEVVAHELAHQWFGNLVTMKWWRDLWLNEGFATYVATRGVTALHPRWETTSTSAAEYMRTVLYLDALQSSHPISVDIDDPKRIDEIFDAISYRKGALLLRMMNMFLGEDVFITAIHNYLVKYSYGNAEQDDLWNELTMVAEKRNVLSSNVTVKEIMDTWTTQTGYPLLTVKRDYDDESLTVTQKRYLSLGAQSETAMAWWVPLAVRCEGEDLQGHDQGQGQGVQGQGTQDTQGSQKQGTGKPRAPLQWLSAQQGTRLEQRYEHGASRDQWLLFNTDMLVPCRVNYDERNWNLLIRALNSDDFISIPTMSRVQLISDTFAFVWTNEISIGTVLNLVNYLQRETEFLPFETGISALRVFDDILKRDSDYGVFQKFVRKLIGPAYKRTGGLSSRRTMISDDLITVKLQVLLSTEACYMKVPGCEENAIALFRDWMQMGEPDKYNPIPLDLRPTVYCVAISRGTNVEWEFLLERLKRSNVASAGGTFRAGLACSRDVWVLKRYLEWSISNDTVIRRQDANQVIVTVMRNHIGYYVAREFLLERIKDIYNAFQGNSKMIGPLLKRMLMETTTEAELNEFLEWKKNNEQYLGSSKFEIGQGIEKARINIGWLKKYKQQFIEQLSVIIE